MSAEVTETPIPFTDKEFQGTVATVHPLRRNMTVALDPSMELHNLHVGPLFSDEYQNLLLNHDPGPEDLERMSDIETAQERLQDSYVSAWTSAATALAESRMITLYVNLGGTEDDGDYAADFRDEVNSLIRVVHDPSEGWLIKF